MLELVSTTKRVYSEKFLKLRPQGKTFMQFAYSFLKTSVTEGAKAWDGIKNRSSGQRNLFPAIVPQFYNNLVDNNIVKLKDIVDNNTTLFRSAIEGDSTHFDIKKYFTEPPADLKAFLPTDFKSGNREITHTLNDGTKVKYRNYMQDSAAKWNRGVWSKYFSDVNKQGVPKVLKILRTSNGAALFRGTRVPLML